MSEPFYRPETKEAWDEVQRVNHDLAKQRDTLGSDLASMQRRAEEAEKQAREWKSLSEARRRNIDTLNAERAADNDAHGKDIDQLQQQIAGLQKALATSEERRHRMVAAFEKLEPNPETQHQIAELTQQRDRLSKTLDSIERENERLCAVIDGIQNLLNLAD